MDENNSSSSFLKIEKYAPHGELKNRKNGISLLWMLSPSYR